jgi:predicted transcriptional regulator
MRVREITTPTIFVRNEDPVGATLEKLQMAGSEHSIVVRNQQIVGVVSVQQLIVQCATDKNAPVGDIALPVPCLHPDDTIKEAANILRTRKVACVPVVNDGTIEGVVTADRLLELIGRGAIHSLPNQERRVMKDRGPKRQKPPKKRMR